ncbi:hypothetical protein D3C80_1667760 [compost metagenome]
MEVAIQHRHHPRPVRAGLAVDQGRVFDGAKQLARPVDAVAARRIARIQWSVDQGQAQTFAGVLLQPVVGLVALAAQIDDGPDPAPFPIGQLSRRGLVGPHQIRPQPVGVGEGGTQEGVIRPEIGPMRLEPAHQRCQIIARHKPQIATKPHRVTISLTAAA